MNLDRLPFDGTAVRIGDTPIPLPGGLRPLRARQAGLSEVVLGLRPNSLTLVVGAATPNAMSPNGTPSLSGRVHLVEDTGSDAWVHLDAPGEPSALRLVARADARHLPVVGDQVKVSVAVNDAHVFDPGSGERLGD